MTQADLAKRTGLSKKTVNQIVHGREPVSHVTALRLERVVGVPAQLLEQPGGRLSGALARRDEKAALTQDLEWLKTIPTKELIRRGVIQGQDDAIGLLQAVLAFFGVNSARQWKALWASPQVAFRRSQVFTSHPGAVAAWIRLGELEGQRLACQPYDKDKFREALQQVRRLTIEGPEVFVPKMREWCRGGRGGRVHTRDAGRSCERRDPVADAGQSVLQLSLRFKSNDHFWFSFFHEAGHILKHGKKEKFVEDGGDHNAKEEEANRLAEDFLIPRERTQELAHLRSREQIVAFSRSIGVAPGIVLGRLQKIGVIDHKCAYNHLKERLQWSQGADGEAVIVRS